MTKSFALNVFTPDGLSHIPCVEFDVSRAYTSFLAEIKSVPYSVSLMK